MSDRKPQVHRYTKSNQTTLAGLLHYLADEDASAFCAYYKAESLDCDPAKRYAVGSLSVILCRLGLTWRRHKHTLPALDEREHIIGNIANSSFADLTRPDLVKKLVWWGCRDYSFTPFEIRNNNLDMTTGIIVGGVLLITSYPYWMERYKIAMRRTRRNVGYDVDYCLEGAVQTIGPGSRGLGNRG